MENGLQQMDLTDDEEEERVDNQFEAAMQNFQDQLHIIDAKKDLDEFSAYDDEESSPKKVPNGFRGHNRQTSKNLLINNPNIKKSDLSTLGKGKQVMKVIKDIFIH